MNKFLIFLLITTTLNSAALAQNVSNSGVTVESTLDKIDSILDYTIGAQRGLSSRRGRPEVDIDLPEFGWNVGASCSGWDVGVSFEGLVDDLDSQLNKLQRNVVNSIRGFVGNLPMLLLQREDPGMYEILNNMLLNGEDIFEAKVETCRNMSERFSKSDNGLGSLQDSSFWINFGQKEKETRQSKGDLVKTIDEAEENKGDFGVVAMCGETCGGAGQPMCRPLVDAIIEGFKKLTGDVYECEANHHDVKPSKVEDETLDNGGKDNTGGGNNNTGGGNNNTGGGNDGILPWYKQIWDKPADAVGWIKRVVGDVQYATCRDCSKMLETPGNGIYDDIAMVASLLRDKISELVEQENIPSQSELKLISSNDVHVNESVILALRDETVSKSLFIDRLAEEIALLRTVDKVLAARRILMAGKSDPSFSSTSKNVLIINAKISLLNDEVSLIKEELELKKIARGDTMQILLSRYESRRLINPESSYQREVQRRINEGVQRVNGGGS